MAESDNIDARLNAPEPPHKPADDHEEVYFEGTPQLRGELIWLAGWWLAGLILIVGGFAMLHFLWWAWWMMLLSLVIGIACLALPIVVTRATRYRITNYRIDWERGILAKSIDTLELWHVEDLHFQQSLLDRMLNVGTITIISHDETTPTLPLNSIPNPRPLYEMLKQRVIAVKRQRGVIKMDLG